MDKRKVKWSPERKAKWLASRYPAKSQETKTDSPPIIPVDNTK